MVAAVAASPHGPLFEKTRIGKYDLDARYVFAPMTRCRGIGNLPCELAIKYYSERARQGVLILTEATNVSTQAQGYPNVPNINTAAHVEAWKPIVKAVHDKGGIFFLQLFHAGRASHQHFQENEELPVAPSAVAITNSQVMSPKIWKPVPYPVPRPLELEEIPGIVEQTVVGAKNSIAAGFDGVELHAATGYIWDQFLKQSSNKRTDEYGGSIENRCRLVLETIEALVKELGGDRVGIRLSPYSWEFNQCFEPDIESTVALNVHLLKELNKFNLAYVHIVTARVAGNFEAKGEDLEKQTLKPFRDAFKGPIIAAGGFIKGTAEEELKQGTADLVTFGRWYLANPDLPERMRDGKPFNKYNRDTFYTSDPVDGYTDYPFLEDVPEGTPTEIHYSGQLVFKPSKQKHRGPEDLHGH